MGAARNGRGCGGAPAECVAAAAAAADAASRGQPRRSVSSPPRLALKVTCRPLDRKARESDCLRPFLGLGPSRRQPSELLLASPDSISVFVVMMCLPAAGANAARWAKFVQLGGAAPSAHDCRQKFQACSQIRGSAAAGNAAPDGQCMGPPPPPALPSG